MKKSILLLSLSFMINLNVNAQKAKPEEQIATFEDGTKITYSVLDNVGDDQLRNTIAAFNQTDDRNIGCMSLMYGRLNPDRFYAHGELGFMLGAGFGGINVGGTYFLGASEKNYELPMSIRSSSNGQTETRYVIKSPAVKNRHFGVNVEAGYKRYAVMDNNVSVEGRSYALTSFSSGEIALGFGYLATKQALFKVDGKSYMGGSHLFHLTADVLFFPGAKFAYTTSDSASAAVPLVGGDITNGKIGFRLLLQGQTALKFNKKSNPTSNFGFYYRLGVIKSDFTAAAGAQLTSSGICVVAGLGFFFSFL